VLIFGLASGVYMLFALIFIEGLVSWVLFKLGIVTLLMIPSTIVGLALIDTALCGLPAGYISAKSILKVETRISLVYLSLSTSLGIVFFIGTLLLVFATRWVMFALLIRIIPIPASMVFGSWISILGERKACHVSVRGSDTKR
jgi:hypothetical protein